MRRETAVAHRALVADALELIQRELDGGELRLELLAERAGVSPFHFHRVFRAVVGESFAGYVRRLRLERAALRLRYSERQVIDIAFEAGYETHESFTRAFKERFGRAPRSFRAEEQYLEIAIDVEPVIVRVPPRRIACVRHIGPYDQTGPAFAKVLAWAGERGLLFDTRLVGIYWDDQSITPPDRTRCEVGVFVDDHAAGDDEVEVRRLAGGDHAVVRFHGSANDRRRSYELLYGRWLPERGRTPADAPPYEAYATYRGLIDGFDLITDVHVPLLPKQAA